MWTTQKTIIFLVPLILIAIAAAVMFFLRKTLRTRVRIARELRHDPDINEWLVVFGWSRKVLYVPTIVASLVAWALMLLHETGVLTTVNPMLVGGVWLTVFVLNFLVDEYEISIKVLLIVVLCALVLLLWLSLLDWLGDFLRFFGRIRASMNSTVYLVLSGLFCLAILVAWLRGLFYYVAITPNYLNIQVGPTETGEQISREEYSTRIDTGDFLERLLGFGKIVVTFADQRRQPMLLLVGRIGRKASTLESIRGKLAVDRHQPAREGAAQF